MNERPIEIVRGGGNAFRDFGYPGSDARQIEAAHGTRSMMRLDDDGLFTRQTEARTGVSHSAFFRIRQAKFRRFTIDWSIAIPERLGRHVKVSAEGEARSNMHVGGRPEKSPLSARDWLTIPRP